jgi:diacylglycerol kinase
MDAFHQERKRHSVSVKTAWAGVRYAWKTQPNFWYHTLFSAEAIVLGFLLAISPVEWLIIILTIIGGLTMEMANTAVESVVDLVVDVWHKDARVAKDVAAGMMLLYACGALVIALLIFGPKFLSYIPLTLVR